MIWDKFDELVTNRQVVIERPQGSQHPSYPEYIYPLNYGYLANTNSNDGAEIDVWLGSIAGEKQVTGYLITVDPAKGDMEIKLLVNCTASEMKLALESSNRGEMVAVLVVRA